MKYNHDEIEFHKPYRNEPLHFIARTNIRYERAIAFRRSDRHAHIGRPKTKQNSKRHHPHHHQQQLLSNGKEEESRHTTPRLVTEMAERRQGGGGEGNTALRSGLSHDLSDTYHTTYLAFYLLGLGSLLPWYFFSTAKGYWDYKFTVANGTGSAGQSSDSDLHVYFESYLSIASTVPNVFVSVLNVLLINKLSANVRVLSSLATMLLVFAVTAALVKVDTSGWMWGFFVVTMTCVVVVNSATAVFLGSLYGLAALFPAKYPQAFITGQAMGGTLSVLASIVDIAAAGDVTDSALAYFLTADVYVLVCIVIYLRLRKMRFARYHIAYEAPPPINYDALDAASVQSDSDDPFLADTDALSAPALPHARQQQQQHRRSFPPVRAILRETRWLCLSVFFCFFVSMILFPPVLANIAPTSVSPESPWAKKYFVPVAIFLVYNLADLVGRMTAGWLRWPAPDSRLVPALVFLRTGFLPLFALCNYQPRRHASTLLLANDAVPVALTALLGLTNGHLGSTALTYAPRAVPAEMAEATGAVMTFFLSLGLAAGAMSSTVFMRFI